MKTKINITNKFTKLFFTQYGVNKMMEFNGGITGAKQYLKANMGINKVFHAESYKRDCFLPIGYSSIETVI